MDKNLHNIDKLFKDGIEGHTDQPDDFVWNNLDQQLDKQEMHLAQKKNILLKRSMLALAALFIIALILLVQQYRKPVELKPSSDTAAVTNGQQQPVSDEVQQKSGASAGDKKQTIKAEQKISPEATTENHLNNTNDQPVLKQQPSTVTPVPTKAATEPAIVTEQKVNRENKLSLKKEQLQKNKAIKESLALNKKGKPVLPGDETIAQQKENNQPQEKKTSAIKQELIGKEQVVPVSIVEKNIQYTEAAFVKEFRPGTLPAVSPQLFNQSLLERNTATPVVITKKKIKPGFSVAAFYTPERLTTHVETGEKEHREDDKDAIREGEQVKYAGSFGVQVQYRFNQRWSVLSGVSYSKTTSVILPRNIYARPERRPGAPQGGDLKYKLNCTAGYVYISPKSATTPAFGDSIQASQSTNTLEYFGVPLGIKYSYQKGKFAVNAVTSLNMNILSNGKLQATTVEQSVKTLSNVKIEGLKPVYFSGMIGLGVEYFLTQRISVFATPVKTFSLSSINKNTPADTKRGSFGLQTGISIKL